MNSIKSAYIHIPFCDNICSYCDFSKMYYSTNFSNDYLDALYEEVLKTYNHEYLSTVYIGGGTPSVLNIEEILKLRRVIDLLNYDDNTEFTIEANPESLTKDKIKLFKDMGVNRVSIGVQSFNKDILTKLNRSHDKEICVKVINDLRYENINNINVDMMYAVMNQTLEMVLKDLEEVISLKPTHISYYSLILEENTRMYNDKESSIDEDLELSMDKLIRSTLKSNGYVNYEISNYSKVGYESKHNLTYWNNEYYYGFGLSSHAYIDNKRISNTRDISKYNKHNFISYEEVIDKKSDMQNFMMLGLRLRKGVSKNEFKNRYNENIEDVFKLDKLDYKDGYYFIKEEDIYISNEILLDFFE